MLVWLQSEQFIDQQREYGSAGDRDGSERCRSSQGISETRSDREGPESDLLSESHLRVWQEADCFRVTAESKDDRRDWAEAAIVSLRLRFVSVL